MRCSDFEQDDGQMAVELVVLIPVILVMMALAVNVLGYLGECARFDRIAAEAVRVEGVAAGYGSLGRASCDANVRSAIEKGFADANSVHISVASRDINVFTGGSVGGDGLLFSLAPSLREYTCTMSYSPPFFASGLFGMSFPPLEHSRVFVVDPYEPSGWL